MSGAAAAAVAIAAPLTPHSVYPGLDSYREQDNAKFHGRDEALDTLKRMVKTSPLSVVYGTSGVGKSSLIQAGLFHDLRAESYLPVMIRLKFDSPGPLAEQVCAELRTQYRRHKIDAPDPACPLRDYFAAAEIWSPRSELLAPLLVFDQFEEIFTVGRDSHPRVLELLHEIASFTEAGPLPARDDGFVAPRPRVLFSLREDFLGHLDIHRKVIPSSERNRYRLTRMRGTDAIEAVVGPGAGIITRATAETLVRFVADERDRSLDPSKLPLSELEIDPVILSLVCRELDLGRQRRVPPAPQITDEQIAAEGRQIIEHFYDDVMSEVPAAVREFIEDELVDDLGFRTSRALRELRDPTDEDHAAIERLLRRRVLRSDRRYGTPHLELVHDRLAAVAKLRRDVRWEDARALALARAREEAVAKAAEETRKEHVRVVAEFRAREAELEAAAAELRARAKVRRNLLVTVGTIAVVVSGATVYAAWNRLESEKREQAITRRTQVPVVQLAHRVATEGRRWLLRGDPATAAVNLAEARVRLGEQHATLDAGEALAFRRSLLELANLVALVRHPSTIVTMRLLDDQRTVVACGRDGTVLHAGATTTTSEPWGGGVVRSAAIDSAGAWVFMIADDGHGIIRPTSTKDGGVVKIDPVSQKPDSPSWFTCVGPDDKTFAAWNPSVPGVRAWMFDQGTFAPVDYVGAEKNAPVSSVTCLDGGRLLIAEPRGEVNVLRPRDTAERVNIRISPDDEAPMSASRDGAVIAVVTIDGVTVLDRPSGDRTDLRIAPTDLPDWPGLPRSVVRRDPATGSLIRAREPARPSLTLDGKLLLAVVSGLPDLVAVWSVPDARLLFAVEREAAAAGWTRDGDALVVRSTLGTEIWRTADWSHVGTADVPARATSLDVHVNSTHAVIAAAVGNVAHVQSAGPAEAWMDRPGPPTLEEIGSWTTGVAVASGIPIPAVGLPYPLATTRVAAPDGTIAVVRADGTAAIRSGGVDVAITTGLPIRGVRWTGDGRLITMGARTVQVLRRDATVELAIATDAWDARLTPADPAAAGSVGALWTCGPGRCEAWEARPGGRLLGRVRIPDNKIATLPGDTGVVWGGKQHVLPPAATAPSIPAQSLSGVGLLEGDGGVTALVTQDVAGWTHVHDGDRLEVLDGRAPVLLAPPAVAPAGHSAAVAIGSSVRLLVGDRSTERWSARAPVVDLAWDAGGTRLAAIDAALNVAVIDGSSLKPVAEWPSTFAQLTGTGATFSPDGDRYAYVRVDGVIEVRKVNDQSLVGLLDTGGRRVTRILLGNPGSKVAALAEDALLTWPPPRTAARQSPHILDGFFDDALFSAVGDRLAARSERGVDVFRTDDRAALTHEFHVPGTIEMSMSDHGRLLSTWRAGSKLIEFWRLDEPDVRNYLDRRYDLWDFKRDPAGRAVFQPGGGIYAWVGAAGAIIRVSQAGGVEREPVKGATDCVFAGAGDHLVCRFDDQGLGFAYLQLVEVPSGRRIGTRYVDVDDDDALRPVVGPRHRPAVIVDDDKLVVWDAAKLDADPIELVAIASGFVISGDGDSVWALAGNGTLTRRDLAAPAAEPTVSSGVTRALDLAMLDPGTALAAIRMSDGTVSTLTSTVGEDVQRQVRLPESDGVGVLRIAADGRIIALRTTRSGGELVIWRDGALESRIALGDARFTDLAVGANGLIAVALGDAVKVWRAGKRVPAAGTAAPTFVGIAHVSVRRIAFDAGGTCIATSASDGTVQLWKVEDKPAAQGSSTLMELARLDAGHNTTGAPVIAFDGHQPPRSLATGGTDGRARVWNLNGASPPPDIEKRILERAQQAADIAAR